MSNTTKRSTRIWVILISVCMLGSFFHMVWAMDTAKLDQEIVRLKDMEKRNPDDFDVIKSLGILFHTKARKDAKNYAPKAVGYLSTAYEINKKDYETMCYLGSAMTMMAKTTWNPIKKMSYVNKGTGLMDKAVRREPDNVTVRMTRALNSKNLPSFLNRGDIALEDFEYLADLIEKNPESLASIKKEVFTNLADLYKKAGDQARAEKFKKLAENL